MNNITGYRRPLDINEAESNKKVKNAVWPDQEAEVAAFEKKLLENDKFKNDRQLTERVISSFIEMHLHSKGVVPDWVKVKREHPVSDIGMIRSSYDLSKLLIEEQLTFSSIIEMHKRKQESEAKILTDLKEKWESGHLNHCIGLKKGGDSGLLNIILDGCLYTRFIGPLQANRVGFIFKETCATSHGPPFIVFKEKPEMAGMIYEIPLSLFSVILVETAEHKERLIKALEKAKSLGLIDHDIQDKIKTYTEFL